MAIKAQRKKKKQRENLWKLRDAILLKVEWDTGKRTYLFFIELSFYFTGLHQRLKSERENSFEFEFELV